MGSAQEEFARLEASYIKSRRTVLRDLLFFIGCLVIALIMRRILNYPPVLSWLVFAVPAVLFGGDVVRFFHRRRKLARFLHAQRSASARE